MNKVKEPIINEAKIIENQYKITSLQLEAIKIVLKEYPECKKALKYVLLEIAGVSEKLIFREIKAEKKRQEEKKSKEKNEDDDEEEVEEDEEDDDEEEDINVSDIEEEE